MTKNNTQRKALVLGEDKQSFLAVIRSLGRAGIEVHVAWNGDNPVPVASRYVQKIHDLPSFSATSDVWKKDMAALLRRENFDLVIPCHDQDLLPLYQHRKDFESLARIALPNEKSFEVFFDKFKSAELARELGIHVPEEKVIALVDQIEANMPRSWPAVLKPRASSLIDDPGRRNRVLKTYSPQEFIRVATQMLRVGPVSVQENFIGEGVGMDVLADHGEVLLAFQHRRVHEPLHGGGASYRCGTPINPELLAAASSLLAAVKYTGVAMVEFKLNRQSRQWTFMEVNARFWGSLPLAIASGADFPRALFEFMVDGRRNFDRQYRPGIYCRHLTSDLYWNVANLRADHLDPTLLTVPLARVFRETFVNVVTGRERNDTFTLDDPVPGLLEVRRILSDLLRAVTKRAAQIIRKTPFARRYLAKRAHHALHRSKNVLFICKGNICRSPFAEYAARHHLPSTHTFASTGYHPVADRCSPTFAVEIARSMDVDIQAHRSTILTARHLRDADVIFVFDQENYQRLRRDFPASKQRIHFLGSLNPAGPLLIPDPWDCDRDTFQTVYQQILAALTSSPAHLHHTKAPSPAASKSNAPP